MAAAYIASLAIENGLTYRKLRALAAFSRSLTMAEDVDRIVEVIGHHLKVNFDCRSVIFLPSDQNLVSCFCSPDLALTGKDREAANLCWRKGDENGGFHSRSVGCPGSLCSAHRWWTGHRRTRARSAAWSLGFSPTARIPGEFRRTIGISDRAGNSRAESTPRPFFRRVTACANCASNRRLSRSASTPCGDYCGGKRRVTPWSSVGSGPRTPTHAHRGI